MLTETKYTSGSQRARVLTESWLPKHVSCPACAATLVQTANNTKARDFLCPSCGDPFELKSKQSKFTNLVADGAYGTMVAAIRANEQPNLFLLTYRLRQSRSGKPQTSAWGRGVGVKLFGEQVDSIGVHMYSISLRYLPRVNQQTRKMTSSNFASISVSLPPTHACAHGNFKHVDRNAPVTNG